MVLEMIPSSTSTITYLEPVPDDPSKRRPDITRASSELDWQPRVPLREGLGKTIDYFREVTAA
jgi:nucleoside-diphosphate-sugar epimerase